MEHAQLVIVNDIAGFVEGHSYLISSAVEEDFELELLHTKTATSGTIGYVFLPVKNGEAVSNRFMVTATYLENKMLREWLLVTDITPADVRAALAQREGAGKGLVGSAPGQGQAALGRTLAEGLERRYHAPEAGQEAGSGEQARAERIERLEAVITVMIVAFTRHVNELSDILDKYGYLAGDASVDTDSDEEGE